MNDNHLFDMLNGISNNMKKNSRKNVSSLHQFNEFNPYLSSDNYTSAQLLQFLKDKSGSDFDEYKQRLDNFKAKLISDKEPRTAQDKQAFVRSKDYTSAVRNYMYGLVMSLQ